MRKFITLFFILLGLAIIGFILYAKGIPQTITAKISHDTARFTGVVTETNLGCMTDGVCSITIDGEKEIVTAVGWSKQISGRIINSEFNNSIPQKGSTVEVYVRKVDGGEYSLYGSRDYYIKVLATAEQEVEHKKTNEDVITPRAEEIFGTITTVSVPFDCLVGEETPIVLTLNETKNIIIGKCGDEQLVRGSVPETYNLNPGDMVQAYVKETSENNYSIFGSEDYFVKVVGIQN